MMQFVMEVPRLGLKAPVLLSRALSLKLLALNCALSERRNKWNLKYLRGLSTLQPGWMGSWFSSVQSPSCVQLFETPWTAARQTSLSITSSQSLHKLMSIASVIPSNHLIPHHPLLLSSTFSSIRVFSNELTLHQVAKVL